MKNQLEELFEELINQQHEKLLSLARKIKPNITEEDLLQPCDYPELENNPIFRHEEGLLEGLHTARLAVLNLLKSGCR